MQGEEVEDLERKLEESLENESQLKLELSLCQEQQRQLQQQFQYQQIQLQQLQQSKDQAEREAAAAATGESLSSSLTNMTLECEHAIKTISVVRSGNFANYSDFEDIPRELDLLKKDLETLKAAARGMVDDLSIAMSSKESSSGSPSYMLHLARDRTKSESTMTTTTTMVNEIEDHISIDDGSPTSATKNALQLPDREDHVNTTLNAPEVSATKSETSESNPICIMEGEEIEVMFSAGGDESDDEDPIRNKQLANSTLKQVENARSQIGSMMQEEMEELLTVARGHCFERDCLREERDELQGELEDRGNKLAVVESQLRQALTREMCLRKELAGVKAEHRREEVAPAASEGPWESAISSATSHNTKFTSCAAACIAETPLVSLQRHHGSQKSENNGRPASHVLIDLLYEEHARSIGLEKERKGKIVQDPHPHSEVNEPKSAVETTAGICLMEDETNGWESDDQTSSKSCPEDDEEIDSTNDNSNFFSLSDCSDPEQETYGANETSWGPNLDLVDEVLAEAIVVDSESAATRRHGQSIERSNAGYNVCTFGGDSHDIKGIKSREHESEAGDRTEVGIWLESQIPGFIRSELEKRKLFQKSMGGLVSIRRPCLARIDEAEAEMEEAELDEGGSMGDHIGDIGHPSDWQTAASFKKKEKHNIIVNVATGIYINPRYLIIPLGSFLREHVVRIAFGHLRNLYAYINLHDSKRKHNASKARGAKGSIASAPCTKKGYDKQVRVSRKDSPAPASEGVIYVAPIMIPVRAFFMLMLKGRLPSTWGNSGWILSGPNRILSGSNRKRRGNRCPPRPEARM